MRLEGPMGSYGDREDPGLHGGMELEGVEKNPVTPEIKKTREPFRETTIIDTSEEGEKGKKEMRRQISDIEDGSGLNVTSYAKRPNGTMDIMLQKIRKINHFDSSKCGYNTSYDPELNKNQAS